MFLYIRDVAALKVDADQCSGCGFCLNVCPRSVLSMRDLKAVIVEKDACIECGACARNCPSGAISVRTGVGCATAILSRSGQCGECCCGKK